MLSSLSAVPPVCPNARPVSLATGTPPRRSERDNDHAHFVPNAARAVLVHLDSLNGRQV